MKKQVIIGIIGLILICLFIAISGCGGGSSTIVPNPSNPTSTPAIIPTATPTPIKYGNISGKILTNINTGYANAFVLFQSLVVNERTKKIEGSGLYTRNTSSDPNGTYTFTSAPQGACRISFWSSQSSYQTDPNSPLGAINSDVGENTQEADIKEGSVAPTPTPTNTPSPTNTVPAGSTPTNTPQNTPLPGEPTWTPTATNTPVNTPLPGEPTFTPSPTATTTNTPVPGATSTNTPVPSADPSITEVKKTSETGYAMSMVETGTEVSIIGTNFGASQITGTVTIGGFSAPVNSWADGLIKAIVPAGALTGTANMKNVAVTTNGGKTASWGELFVNSDLQEWYSSSNAMKDITFNSTGDKVYFTHAPTSVSRFNFPDLNSASPITTTFVDSASYMCFNPHNNRVYVSTSNVDNYNNSLGDAKQIFPDPPIFGNTTGIRWNAAKNKMYIVDAFTQLMSMELDGSNRQLIYSSPTNVVGIDCDSEGYTYIGGSRNLKIVQPNNIVSTNQINDAWTKYVYCKEISGSNIKLLFVTSLLTTGYNCIKVYKIKNNSSNELIKIYTMENINQKLAGINGYNGYIAIVDENMKKIYLMLF